MRSQIWASSALALLMGATPVLATPGAAVPDVLRPASPVIRVQDQPASEEELLRQRQQQEEQQQQEAPPEPQPEAAPEQRAPEPEPQPEAPAPQPEPAPAPEPEQQPEAQPEQRAPEPVQPEQAPEPEQRPAEPAPQAEQPRAEPPAEAPVEAPAEPAPDQPREEQPKVEQPRVEPTPEAAPEPQPAERQQQPEQAPQQPAVEQAPPAPAERPAEPEAAPAEPTPAPERAVEPEQPAAPAPEAPAQSGETVLPENAAPVLDSQKQPLPAEGAPEQRPQVATPAAPTEPAAPPPDNDNAAQQQIAPVELQPVTAEKGTRVEQAPTLERRERPQGVDVVREIGDRLIIQFNNQVIVESNDRPRMSRGARDVYYEDLPRGRTRETIVRENGIEIVTIRNRYGDVIRRSRVMPDGTEYILAYVDDDEYEDRREWRDPGEDLPPMRLTIPVSDYILDAGRVDDEERYYEFLEEPPVERVERLYSVDEVKRSARVRDKTRRVDMDTITFDFGAASIAESEIPRLEGVASAMERLLKKNPAETFLIEGHTDAVGTDVANLALSDRRAEAVADALTNVFGIPPENLATQGYGEQYLKVRSQQPERINRRVAIRRITALVAPVASAN